MESEEQQKRDRMQKMNINEIYSKFKNRLAFHMRENTYPQKELGLVNRIRGTKERNQHIQDWSDPKSRNYQQIHRKLESLNYIYRFINSSNRKYMDQYSEIVKLIFQKMSEMNEVRRLEKYSKINQDKMLQQKVVSDLLKVLENNMDDTIGFQRDIDQMLGDVDNSLVINLYQRLRSVKDQEMQILGSDIVIEEQNLIEYKCQDYSNVVDSIFINFHQQNSQYQYNECNPDNYNPNPFLINDADEELKQLIEKQNMKQMQNRKQISSIKLTRKQQKQQQNNLNIDINRIQDIKNHFKEFMEKYGEIVIKGKEFWSLFIFDILRELDSSKEDDFVFAYLYDAIVQDDSKDMNFQLEGVEYLMTYRKEIKGFLKMVRFFDNDEKSLKDNRIQKNYMKEINRRPQNFQSNRSQQNQYQHQQMIQQQQEIQQQEDNQKLMKLIGMNNMSDNTQFKKKKKEMKQNTTVQEICGEVDFINMDEGRMRKEFAKITRHDDRDQLWIKIDKEEKIVVDESQLVQISSLESWCQGAFSGLKTLNTLQSRVYENAFVKDENLLICAPTGAGKTNVALLTILQCVSRFLNEQQRVNSGQAEFKIVYISPMKALASEIVEKFESKLKYLGVIVKELTGDMSLTRTELINTHIIVTTPEKWDVITRKTDGISQTLKLLIIDEIHLLNDERGPILECLVARTLRQVERLQSSIRIVGLSATLPNFKDVAMFIGANSQNIFFFGNSYRPVPLVQYFIGIKEQTHMAGYSKYNQRMNKNNLLNDVCYANVKKYLKLNKQVMIFVHSRRETLLTAEMLLKTATDLNELKYFSAPQNMGQYVHAGSVKSKQLRNLLVQGAGIHNAGLLRKDRNLVEKLFYEGKIRFLVSTATLAWGVNLPAYAVVIKGTDIYDPTRGNSDLSILDIKQIFGRAGRPQFDDNGEAVLITDLNKVNQYIASLNNSQPIESKLLGHLGEALNAEISLNNISNQLEAFDWLRRTFLGVRLVKNPQAYGLRFNGQDSKELQIELFLQQKIENQLKELDGDRLIRYDNRNLYLNSTEIGRITSQYYVRCDTMKLITESLGLQGLDFQRQDNTSLKGKNKYWTDLSLMQLVARSKEFEGIKVREEEQQEIQKVITEYWVFQSGIGNKPKGPQDKNIEEGILIDVEEKILGIICAYMTNFEFSNFSLVVDMNYVGQNSVRILRCIYELSIKKNLAQLAELALNWCRYLEHRVTYQQSTLRQFTRESQNGSVMAFKLKKNHHDGFLSTGLLQKLEYPIQMAYFKESEIDYSELYNYTAAELTKLIGLQDIDVGRQIKKFVNMLPKYDFDYELKPIASTILKIKVTLNGRFHWNNRWHGGSQYFWIIVDDDVEILHCESVVMTYNTYKEVDCSFFIPYRDTQNKQYRLRICPDQWVNMDTTELINLENINMQVDKTEYTQLLDLQPLPISALNNVELEKTFKQKGIRFFNPIQTQLFHTLYHGCSNVLVGAPTGSGKTILAELCMYRLFKENQEEIDQLQVNERRSYIPKKVVYVAPLKALAKERIKDWSMKFDKNMGIKTVELTGDYTPDLDQLLEAQIVITTPEKWDGISRNWENRSYVKRVGLIVLDEIHLLGQDRGPVIEVIVTRMNYIAQKLNVQVRMLGLSTAMANGNDVANWFGVNKYTFFNFKPNVRPCPITIYFDGFAEKHYCPRMNTMNKPAFTAIKKFSPDKPVLIFVSSRRQTRLTALDLISLATTDNKTFVNCNQDLLNNYIDSIRDTNLKQTLAFGIGMHHAGLIPSDRTIVEDLFNSNKIQIMIATQTVAWGVNFPARLVIIKGTEFFDPKVKGYVDFPVTDILQMIGRAGRPQFDDFGIACVYVEESKKNFYKKYLNDPFPIESSLLAQLSDHVNAECNIGTISNKKNCLDYLTWTYFFRRLIKNPNFYGLENNEPKTVNNFMNSKVNQILLDLENSGCIEMLDEFNFQPTFLGNLASFYYVKHETIKKFNQKIVCGMSQIEILDLLSSSYEFIEMPVRHNEDNYNEALLKLLPYQSSYLKNSLDSPYTKTNLLLQAHFSRTPLPIRDYNTDTKLLLDQAIRLIHCMIDLAAEKGYLDTTLQVMSFMQMVIQGLWADDSSLINVPNFDADIIRDLKKDKDILYLCQLMEHNKENPLNTYLFRKGLDQEQIEETIQSIEYVPELEVKLNIFDFDSEKHHKTENPLKQDGEALLQVNLRRINHQYPLKVNMIKTLKVKDASWWLVVGNLRSNQLISVKKVFFKKTLKKQIQIQLPPDFSVDTKLDLFLVSDSYLGIDQMFRINLEK